MTREKQLIVITGPTASGKTDVAIAVAQALGCEIVNADSRQIYQGIPICTAVPSAAQRALVRHHLLEFLPLDRYYNAAMFEQDALRTLNELWKTSDYAVLCGGSMMYVDAVCNGMDALPDISEEVRAAVTADFERVGLQGLLEELERRDPACAAVIDRKNPRRVMHALEICRQTGTTYSSLLTGQSKQRDFKIHKFAMTLDRATLYDRINRRVDRMVHDGLEEEARSVEHLRTLNSLNTVGMKEMFAYFDGKMDRTTAIERIKKNTRVYAKKQLTWLARTNDATPVSSAPDILSLVHRIG